jgi:hypothetical protein
LDDNGRQDDTEKVVQKTGGKLMGRDSHGLPRISLFGILDQSFQIGNLLFAKIAISNELSDERYDIPSRHSVYKDIQMIGTDRLLRNSRRVFAGASVRTMNKAFICKPIQTRLNRGVADRATDRFVCLGQAKFAMCPQHAQHFHLARRELHVLLFHRLSTLQIHVGSSIKEPTKPIVVNRKLTRPLLCDSGGKGLAQGSRR